MSSSENVTVTLKAAVGYDAPWIVVKGETTDQVAKHLAEAFGIGGRLAEEGTLHQVLLQANAAFQSGQAVASTLGGQVIVEGADSTASPEEVAEAVQKATPKPARTRKKAEPEPQAPEPEKAPENPAQEAPDSGDDINADLLALVEAESTADGLLKLYHSNRAGFSAAPEALKALQVKGKKLKGAK